MDPLPGRQQPFLRAPQGAHRQPAGAVDCRRPALARGAAGPQARPGRPRRGPDERAAAGSHDQAKALQAEWKQVGTVRGEESDRIWQRFMVACDKIFELSALEYHLRKRQPGGAGGRLARRARPRPRARPCASFSKTTSRSWKCCTTTSTSSASAPPTKPSGRCCKQKSARLSAKFAQKTTLIALLRQQLRPPG